MFISLRFHWKREVFIAVLVTVFSFFATMLLSTRNRLKVSFILLIYFSAFGIFQKIIIVLIKCCFQIKMITLTWHFRLWQFKLQTETKNWSTVCWKETTWNNGKSNFQKILQRQFPNRCSQSTTDTLNKCAIYQRKKKKLGPIKISIFLCSIIFRKFPAV